MSSAGTENYSAKTLTLRCRPVRLVQVA
jgi:hypothetical protein